MTPEEIGARLASLLGAAGQSPSAPPEPIQDDARAVTGTVPSGSDTALVAAAEKAESVSGGGAFARATVDVPLAGWRDAVRAGRDDPALAFDFFDWLSAVDEEAGGFTLVVHVWSTRNRHGALIRTRLADRAAATAPSIVDIYPGAAWHERETREMFGISFTDPGDDRSLLLPPEFEGHPLRKDFVLAARVAKPWPGAKEPGESGHGPAKRQPMRPPGVPDPREWGPDAGAASGRSEAEPVVKRSRPATGRAGGLRPEPERPERPARPERRQPRAAKPAEPAPEPEQPED